MQDIEEANLSNFRSDETMEQFVIKRSDLNDVLFISSSNGGRTFSNYFGCDDIEMIYENSLFSVTVIDTKNSNAIAGVFVFNDTPFSPIKQEGVSNPGGMWEEFLGQNYEEMKLNGKNSLWLVYFAIVEDYLETDEILKKIFHKTHLSLYTTLSSYHSILFLGKLVEWEKKVSQVNDELITTAKHTIRLLTGYMYEELNPNSSNSLLNLPVIYVNHRITVFPLIEIRVGAEFDHDDLENIFKDQTPQEMTNIYEDFFIAKMIANQDDQNKVLVGQVNDKAVGMMGISTDVNVPLLIRSFNLEKYDNLLKQDYMNAVKLKRSQIKAQKDKITAEMDEVLMKRYQQEVKRCERIAQRIYLQEYIITREKDIDDIDDIEKNAVNKDELSPQNAVDTILKVLDQYSILYPKLEQFDGKIKVDSGSCLLIDEFNFFLETLEFFGLPKGYMQGSGHWDDWLEKEAVKRAQKEKLRKQLGQDTKKKTHRSTRRDNDEPVKPNYFDFSPLGKAMRLFKEANLRVRTFIRKVVKENKHLIAGFFVNEEGEPSHEKCFDLMSLHKKLSQAKVPIPADFANKIGAILLCFGGLNYRKRVVQRVPEEEIVIVEKKETKKPKHAKKKEIVVEEKKAEVKPINVTIYEVSISEFFEAVDRTFEYDKLLFETGAINDDEFKIEYDAHMQLMKEQYEKSLLKEKSLYLRIKDEIVSQNIQTSEESLRRYSSLLETYEDETSMPPTPVDVINAFCVKIFFMEQAFDSRSSDFLMHAFDCFPDKDYLLITQPHSFTENYLLENFIRVEKKVDSLFNDVLYILHRESLMVSLLQVQHATEEDLTRSAYLFENLNGEGEYLFQSAIDAVRNSNSKFVCVCYKIKNEIIGVSLFSKEVNVNYYDSHFNIGDYSNLSKISRYSHSRIIFFQIHKNFTQFTKIFLKETMRLLGKISIYYEIPESGNSYYNFIKEMIITRNRRFPHLIKKNFKTYEKQLHEDEKINTRQDGEGRDEYDENEAEFCLAYTSKKMLAETRIVNNNRIVVVGASDTGISFIESLLSIRYLEFSHIYLVSPGGLLYHQIEDEIMNLKVSMNNYQLRDLKRLLLEQRIHIINSKMIDIKPKQKYIQFEEDTVLYYDYLVLTLGLQDRLWNDIRAISFKYLDEKFNEMREQQDVLNPKEILTNKNLLTGALKKIKDDLCESIFSIDDPYIAQKFSLEERRVKMLRKNPKYEIILYGRSINLLCFIQGLLRRNVPPHKIKLVIPNVLFDHPLNKEEKAKSKKDQNLIEEYAFVNSNSLEDTKEVEEYLMRSLTAMGVQMYENFNFVGVDLKHETFNDPTNLKGEINEVEITSFRFHDETKDKFEHLTANLIVTGGMIDVDPIVFKFIHENGLVYNGRAIIDKNFTTANPFIFAAGRLCEFSQRYSYTEKFKLLKLESYNSQEVGYTLAKNFLQTIDSQFNVSNSNEVESKVPTFYLPVPMGCYLPGDLQFYKIKSVKETNPKVIEKGLNRNPLIFNNIDANGEGVYLKFTFNTFGIIDSVTFLGKMKVDYKSIISLVGLHENYLNELLARYEINLVDDILEFLSENWARAIYHDKFNTTITIMKSILQENDVQMIINNVLSKNLTLDRNMLKVLLKDVSEDTQKKIEYEIIGFIKENRTLLPFYHTEV